MKDQNTDNTTFDNGGLYLRGVPVKQIHHPEMDPQDPYKPFHTGLYRECVVVGGVTYNFFSYIPQNFAPSGPQIMVFPDNGEVIPENWLKETGWAQAAEQHGFMLCVVPAPSGVWGADTAAERAAAEAIFLTTLDRCLYNSNESVFYTAGFGAGNQMALFMALLHCDWISGVVACNPPEAICENLLNEAENTTVGHGDPVRCSQVAVHAWVIQGSSGSAASLVNHLKAAAHVKPEPLYHSLGEVYLSDPREHFAAINEYPVAQIWVSREEDLQKLTPVQICEQMWKFLGQVKRWRGAVCGSLRPSRTMEQQRLIRFEKEIDGFKRYWHLFVPSRFYRHPEEHYPLVVCTHGYSCSSEIWSENSDWHIVGEARNFFVLYATALPYSFPENNWVPLPQWNTGYWKKESRPDDCRYILEAIHDTCTSYPINASRIYAAGHSNGGSMCEELMFLHPEVFAAFGPAGYSYGEFDEEIPELSDVKRPMMLHKSEYDLLSAADLQDGSPNARLLQCICAVDHADYSAPHLRENGQYRHMTYLTEDGIPMVRFVITRNMNHTYTPELAWMTWDDFFAHFERDDNGSVRYLY